MNNETGFVERRSSNGEIEYIDLTAPPGTHKLKLPTSSLFCGYAHVHNDKAIIDGKEKVTIKIFSPQDLKAFTINCQQNATNMGLTYKDTYGIVITSMGTFALKMLTPTVDVSEINWNDFGKDYIQKTERLIEEGNLDSEHLQIMFLKFLKSYKIDTNVGLFKATNDNLTEWKRVTLNGKYLNYSSCN